MDGLLLLDKAAGLTSHDALEEVRRTTGDRHAGHAGTLDPAATGLLVVALGRARRLLPYMEDHDKEYLAAVRLGASTDTDDAEGRVLAERDPSAVTRADVEARLSAFRGRLRQRPPAYSAVKVDGVRSYRRARAGETVELPEREVTVTELELTAFEPPVVRLRIRCSRGTYIRSIARDLGEALGVGAHLAELRRTASGPFRVEQAVKSGGDFLAAVLPPDAGLAGLPAVELGEGEAARFLQGRILDQPAPAPFVRVVHEGRLLGIGEPRDGRLKPRVVLGG